MNASGMTKRNVVLGSAVMQLCDLSLALDLDAAQQASSLQERT
jgi:hypothetical protein